MVGLSDMNPVLLLLDFRHCEAAERGRTIERQGGKGRTIERQGGKGRTIERQGGKGRTIERQGEKGCRKHYIS